MSPFIETICIENGCVHNLHYHNERMNRTRREVLRLSSPLDLADYVQPEAYTERTKCRVEYGADILQVEYVPYHIRPVSSLRLVSSDTICYRYKSMHRSALNELFSLRQEADDILIVRNGLLTDTSICNIALWNGLFWATPAQPLLEGTMRASLLEAKQLISVNIPVVDLPHYSRIRLFNSMIGFGEIEFSVGKILL